MIRPHLAAVGSLQTEIVVKPTGHGLVCVQLYLEASLKPAWFVAEDMPDGYSILPSMVGNLTLVNRLGLVPVKPKRV